MDTNNANTNYASGVTAFDNWWNQFSDVDPNVRVFCEQAYLLGLTHNMQVAYPPIIENHRNELIQDVIDRLEEHFKEYELMRDGKAASAIGWAQSYLMLCQRRHNEIDPVEVSETQLRFARAKIRAATVPLDDERFMYARQDDPVIVPADVEAIFKELGLKD